MPSELGRLVRRRREDLEIGLRELARRIGKSPAFLVSIELDATLPGVSEETLRSIGRELDLAGDLLLTIAGKTPEDVTPRSPLEVDLYRRIQKLSNKDQEELLRELSTRG